MKKLAFLVVLALELAVGGCGTSPPIPTPTTTTTNGNWEAQLTGGTEQASQLNFVTAFSLTITRPSIPGPSPSLASASSTPESALPTA